MKKIIALIILVAIVLLAAVTCPTADAHKDVISGIMSNAVDDKINEELNGDSSNLLSAGIASIGSMFAGKLIEDVVDTKVEVSNYIVCSVGKIHWQGEDKTISIGAFNQIWTFSEKDIKKVLADQGL